MFPSRSVLAAVVACEFGEPEAVPNEFEPDGGSGTITYGVNAPACACSGQVTAGAGWLSVGAGSVDQLACVLGFTVDPWPEATEGDQRAGTVSTPAGDLGISQVHGGNVAGEIPGGICDLDPDHPDCPGGVDDPVCGPFDPGCDD